MMTSGRSVFITIALIVCILCVQESLCRDENRCGQWQFGACERLNKNGGTCGRGVKKATRTGDTVHCRPLQKTVACKVPCSGHKKVCKYRKGQWSECDQNTLKRTRTDTLMAELSDPTCENTRPFEKVCKKRLCQYGPWTDFGPCENGRQTKTRPILNGPQEQCGIKAKKTKRCSATRQHGRRKLGSNNH